jgi:hypothetical protein
MAAAQSRFAAANLADIKKWMSAPQLARYALPTPNSKPAVDLAVANTGPALTM